MIDSLRRLRTHRSLLWQFTLRAVELRHKGSHLGLVWSVLSPLLLLGLYVFVFGFVFDGRFGVAADETKADYALGIFLGLTILHLLTETIGSAPTLILSQPNLVKKVVFPLEILPAAAVGAAVVHSLISLALVLLGLLLSGHAFDWRLLLLPVILPPVVLLALGLAWLFSAVGVFLRDLGQVTAFLSMVLMFASAVFYPASRIPAAAWTFLQWNPVLVAIEAARGALLWGHTPSLGSILFLWLAGLLCAALGLTCFERMKPAFADVL